MIGQPRIFREEIDSTNALAKALVDDGAEHGTAVVAKRQTAGRGRRGRTWAALPGEHVYLSVILRPELEPERVPELTLVAAVAVSDALARFGVTAGIKWPNDLQMRGRKLCGILSELVSDSAGGIRAVILGIGVNVSAREDEIPPDLRDIATSIFIESGTSPAASDVTDAILDRLDHWFRIHATSTAAVLDAWRERSNTLGTEVRVLVGTREISGRAEGIDHTGALLVRTPDDTQHRVIAGEVTTLRAR